MSLNRKHKHSVTVVLSNPNNPVISKRRDTIQRKAKVTAIDREGAIQAAIDFYKKQGYKVHDHHYNGIVTEGSVGLMPPEKMMGGQKAAYNLGKKHGAEGKRINAEKSFGVHSPYYDLGHKHGAQERDGADAFHEKQQSGRGSTFHESEYDFNESVEKLTFKQYLIETATDHDLFIGRFQPFHKGHAEIVKMMNNPIIVIVKGKATSEDKQKNPLSVDQQEKLIKAVYPNIPVFVSDTSGFIPAIIGMVKDKGYTVKRVFAGEDRIGGYKGQVERANKKIEAGQSEHEPIDVEFVKTPRFTSATAVRNAIRSDNFDEYKKLMPSALANEKTFKALQKTMSLVEGYERSEFSAWNHLASQVKQQPEDRDAAAQRFTKNMQASQLDYYKKRWERHNEALSKTKQGSTAYNIIKRRVDYYKGHLDKLST